MQKLRTHGGHEVLSHDEVCALSRRVQAGIAGAELLASGHRTDLPDEERRRAERDVAVGDAAKWRIVEHNLRLVGSWSRRYAVDGMTSEDHFQNGCIGLFRAVEKFDPDSGNQFSTYATWWIRQSITRGIADQARIIRLPVHVVEAMRKVQRARERLILETGRAPNERVAEIVGMPVAKIELLLRLLPGAGSLDAVVGDGLNTIGDLIPAEAPDESMDGVPDAIEEAMDLLDERERTIIDLRYGLTHDDKLTLEQVGTRFGLTRERIRQIEQKALAKMRPTVCRALEVPEHDDAGDDRPGWTGTNEQVAQIAATCGAKLRLAIDTLITSGGSMAPAELAQRFGKSNEAYSLSIIEAMAKVTRAAGTSNPMRTDGPTIVLDPRFSELWSR